MEKEIPRFLMFVGIAGSGKSTVAKQLMESTEADVVYLSSDDIREEIHGDAENQDNPAWIFHLMGERTRLALKAGKSVIYDATNISRKRRIGVLKQLPRLTHKTVVYMANEFSVTKAQNMERDRIVPSRVLNSMHRQLQIPIYSEGWNNIVINYHEDILANEYPKQFSDAVRAGVLLNREGFELMNFMATYFEEFFGIVDMSQDSKYHNLSIGRHIYYVYEHVLNNYETEDEGEKEMMLWTALLHDVGKKFSKNFFNRKGEPTRYANFIGHENVGAQMAMPLLKRLGFEDSFIENVALLIQFHMYLLDANASRDKLLNYVGEDNFKRLEFLREADTLAH